MMSKPRALFLILVLFITACKKNDDTSPLRYKIQLAGGNNQTDTIGRVLKTQVSVLPAIDGHQIREGYVRFETMDCDNSPKDVDLSVRSNDISGAPVPLFYSWQLNQTIGTQTLKVILLDSVKNHKDSLTVTATGIAPSGGWHISGCIPINSFCVAFAQSQSGRIFTALHQQDYPYYSDDNGATWHALTSFPKKSQIAAIVTGQGSDVYATVAQTGIYYSPDKGQNWQLRSAGLPMDYYYGDLRCTAEGNLFVLTSYGNYYSTDKGQNWQTTGIGITGGPSSVSTSFATSMTDGTIIAILNGTLVKSRNGGAGWAGIFTAGYRASAMLVDGNNYIYIGTGGDVYNTKPGIYLSKDTGQTWTIVYDNSTATHYDKSIYLMSQKNGSYYFYSTGNYFLTRTSDFRSYSVINPPAPLMTGSDAGRNSFRYIVTNDNHIILSTEQYGLFYQTP